MELARICVLLPVVGAQTWMLIRKDKELRISQKDALESRRESENNRVADLKVINDKLMSLNDTWNTTLGRMVEGTNATRESLKELREALKDLQDAMFNRITRD